VTTLDDREALLEVVQRMRRFDWGRALVGVCAMFHLSGAAIIGFAPEKQLITIGTRPVFRLLMDQYLLPMSLQGSRVVWTVLFLAAGIAATLLTIHPTGARELVTWFLVIPIGFTWSATYALNVLQGGGSAMGAIGWPTLLLVWGIAAFRVALEKR
jgi:hypothetical protein